MSGVRITEISKKCKLGLLTYFDCSRDWNPSFTYAFVDLRKNWVVMASSGAAVDSQSGILAS